MRVLLVSANFRPSVGGIERFVEILAEGLSRRGHEVTVAACRTNGGLARERTGGVDIVRIPSTDVLDDRLGVPYPLPSPAAAVRTLQSLVAQVDVAHVQDAQYLTSVATLALARRRGVASVLTQHVAFVSHGNALLDAGRHVATWTLGRAARLADRVAAYNPRVAEWTRETWGLRDVRLLPIGVLPAEAAPAERAEVRRELGLQEDAFLALFAGRDVPRKRLDVFLGAADPAYELVAVTDRADDGASGARIVPFMAPERFARLLAAADAFVIPSVGEGFPLALQEALVAGVPCVVTREPGYERFLAEDDVVFVASEAAAVRQALRELAADPHRCATLAQRAREVGRREFGVEGFVEAYESLYADAVAA